MNTGTQRRKKLVVKLVIISGVLYIIFLFISQFIRLRDKREEIQKINEEILIEKSKSEQILGMLDAKESENNSENSSKEDEASNGAVRVFESVTR